MPGRPLIGATFELSTNGNMARDGAESRLNGVSAQLDIAREVNCFAILARTPGMIGHISIL